MKKDGYVFPDVKITIARRGELEPRFHKGVAFVKGAGGQLHCNTNESDVASGHRIADPSKKEMGLKC
jgi:hypothetical protein